MARRTLPRLVLVALAVAALASCSDDEPEPVATGGGIELSATTTEQPRITEAPDRTTTTSTTTTEAATTTTSTTTTTTAPPPPVPTAEEILGALPGPESLSAGEWVRSAEPTQPVEETERSTPLCDGAEPTPLGSIVYEAAGEGGAKAHLQRPDESTRVTIAVVPLADAGGHLAQARTALDACAAAGGSEAITVLPWPTVGEVSVAYGRTVEGVDPEAGSPVGQRATWALVHVGGLVVGLNVQSYSAEGQALAPAPTEAELQAFLQTTVDAVTALPAT